ncbi:MAG TPA: metallophosphoesterase [Pyrinomonadaceae bacterium]|nr:metallophosphoesterase [Pyrinomonadaceae bacterium]
MTPPNWKQLTRRRTLGLLVMGLGLTVLLMPVFVGQWVISILGVVMVAAGFLQFVEILRSSEVTKSVLSYVGGVVTTLLGVVLFFAPDLALSGLLIGLTVFLVIDGATKIIAAYKLKGPDRWWSLFNGIFTVALGGLIWSFVRARFAFLVISVALGLRLMVHGWTMVFQPERGFETIPLTPDPRQHPDRLLRLAPSDAVRDMQEPLLERRAIAKHENIVWCLMLLLIFFAIHVLRTDAKWSFIGFISPFSAVIGDMVVAFILAIVLLLPIRLLFRKMTRPIERTAWNRLTSLHEKGESSSLAERSLKSWLGLRLKFALEMRELRSSLNYAFWQVLRIGLPLTAVLIAVNSIWGFSWYFNSENWASGVWQQITQKRVDVWRQRMTEDVERAELAKGLTPDKIFSVAPDGVTNDGDFSFIVIGDTGEGDPSQMSLRDQLIAASKREAVKFLVLSSDVIYPDGKMKDYETNFYLPFKGFEKPIYAIPGNHDWFDADEGFNANFLDAESANLALRARLAADLQTKVITTDQRFAEIINEAKRLREYYGIKNGLQRGPYFEIHSNGFSLIAVDTGILRTIDAKQEAWLEQALTRAGGNFKMVVIGHPFYVNGAYQGAHDEPFNKIHETLKRFGVDVAMAGDTHDFEFYKTNYSAGGAERQMLNFVNGGGGAYLSIGTSLGFPEKPVTNDYAFYPRTDQLLTKIRTEAPYWKMPFVWWMRWLHGYPFDNEMVSGAFDFNRAPFFQSFLEVSVERSQHRVRYILYGVNGRLRWRDIQVGGDVKPPDKSDDDFVEFMAPLH